MVLADDPDAGVRRELAQAVGAWGRNARKSNQTRLLGDAISLLRRLASDNDWQVRLKAALSALQCASKDALPIVHRLLGDKQPEVRDAALKAYLGLLALYPQAAASGIMLKDAILGDEGAEERKGGHPAFPRLKSPGKDLGASIQISVCPLPEGGKSISIESILSGNGGAPTNELTLEPVLSPFQELDEQGGETRPARGAVVPDLVCEKMAPPDHSIGSPRRFVNSWFTGHPSPLEPLAFQQEYELGIEVSPNLCTGCLTQRDPQFNEPLSAGPDVLDVIVGIVSDDFEVLEKPVKRMGLPGDPAQRSPVLTFRVRPVKNNQDVHIHVLFYSENNLFHEALVGAHVQAVTSPGKNRCTAYFPPREVFHSDNKRSRDLNLQVVAEGDSYRLILCYQSGGDFELSWCRIALNRARLANLIEGARDELLKVVHARGPVSCAREGEIFYDGESRERPASEKRLPNLLRLDDAAYSSVLETLARAGRSLYVNLFQSGQGTPEDQKRTSEVGERLRALSSSGPLKIQILSNEFFIPWNILYDGEYPAAQISPDAFWGFKHTIEEIPKQTAVTDFCQAALSVERVSLGMNVNRAAIDAVLTEPQLNRIRNLAPGVGTIERFTESAVLDALRGKSGHGQLEYFYCHAAVDGNEQGDFDRSYIGLTSATKGLTLEDIKLATAGTQLEQRPVVFLNACESARMDGRFYDGFVPKFLAMGARAVVGTDCEAPSLLAAHVGMAFLEGFLEARPVGQIMLEQRKRLIDSYRNPLGLIYRVFGDADVRLERRVSAR
jgi:hypothetical protein